MKYLDNSSRHAKLQVLNQFIGWSMFIAEQYQFLWNQYFWDAYREYSWSNLYACPEVWESL